MEKVKHSAKNFWVRLRRLNKGKGAVMGAER